MRELYPLWLRIDKSPCLVIGGGAVALRKVKALLRCKAYVTVVSPSICPGLEQLARNRSIRHIRSKYRKNLLKDKFLVISATDQPEVNSSVADDARSKGMLVNVVDRPELCNFFVPSVLHRKQLMLAVGTNGEFPAMAKKIKEECVPVLDKYASGFSGLSRLRREVKKEVRDPKARKIMIERLLDPLVMDKVRKKKIRTVADLSACCGIK